VATAYTIETKDKHKLNAKAMVKEGTCTVVRLQVSLGSNLKVFTRIVVFRATKLKR
jgi:hypothetical protein